MILDANPAAKGHALILPKEHYANLYELDDELAGKSMILAKKMITKLTKALDCDGYNIVQNNGEDTKMIKWDLDGQCMNLQKKKKKMFYRKFNR